MKFQSISILAIFDGKQAFIVSTEAKLDRHFKVSTDALAVLSYLNSVQINFTSDSLIFPTHLPTWA